MNSEKDRQLPFSEFSPLWPKSPEGAIGETCTLFYQKTLDFQKSLSALEGVKIIPLFEESELPRICDVNIPVKFVPVLNKYIRRRRSGPKSVLPENISDFIRSSTNLFLHEAHPLPIEIEYESWANDIYGRWLEGLPQRPNGHVVSLKVNERYLAFRFSEEGGLEESLLEKEYPFPLQLPHHLPLKTRLIHHAIFKDEKLFYLWYEEANDTFFPDPRGPKAQIYPWWVRDVETKSGGKPGTEADWKEYLEKVRKGEPVVSGRTFKRVLQSPKAAVDNMERWRNYIYYRYPQVFHFKLSPFKGELGYGCLGNYGYFVSKNPITYRALSVEETKEMMNKLVPTKL